MVAKIIDNVDEVLRIAREIPKATAKYEQPTVSLIHRQDNLATLLFELIDAGYNPGINFEAGRITSLKMEFNGTFYIIQTQQLIKSAIDGVVAVEDEATYNNMNQAMTSLNHQILMNSHKSYYTEFDMNVLDEYRTKPIVGNLADTSSNKLVEIDISKAYTSALCKISEIPIFNEFDNFKPCDGQAIEPLNLYVVKNKPHALASQSHSLLYGKYLPADAIIQAVKTPSFIKKVDYEKAINDLYATPISNDEDQDAFIKKLIANVNIGLLEKSFNKRSKGYLFQDLAECQYYQSRLGGVIHIINKIEDVAELKHSDLDEGVDCPPCESHMFKATGEPLYVLVLKAESKLKNGFRYIKELLLQHHNQKLTQAFDTLESNGINVCSVKTDCFTIKASDLAKAQGLLSFDQCIGSWRVSKTDGI